MKNKGPWYVGGGWDARLIYPRTETEEEVMGKLTVHTDGFYVCKFAPGMLDDGDRPIKLAV